MLYMSSNLTCALTFRKIWTLSLLGGLGSRLPKIHCLHLVHVCWCLQWLSVTVPQDGKEAWRYCLHNKWRVVQTVEEGHWIWGVYPLSMYMYIHVRSRVSLVQWFGGWASGLHRALRLGYSPNEIWTVFLTDGLPTELPGSLAGRKLSTIEKTYVRDKLPH